MRTKFSRRFIGYGIVAALCAASVLVSRGTHRPFSTTAPDFRSRGPADAKVQIVEFSDFQCPACRIAEPVIRPMLALYDGRVRFTFKHYPLRMHEWARAGAYAAECAGRQGQFWPYHDTLYDHQDDWTSESFDAALSGYAGALKLDMKAWNACRQDPGTKAVIDGDIKDGGDAWVAATPTFFVNGRRFVGARELRDLALPFIDKELKK
jgi:protein-disulfide isomerase